MKKIILSAALMFGLVIGVNAGQYQLLAGGTNNVPAGTTNTYAIASDTTGVFTNGIAYGGQVGPDKFATDKTARDLNYGISFLALNPSANPTTLTFRFAGSLDNVHWTNNIATATCAFPGSLTNYVTIVGSITNCPPFVALRAVESPTTATSAVVVTNLDVRAFEKK